MIRTDRSELKEWIYGWRKAYAFNSLLMKFIDALIIMLEREEEEEKLINEKNELPRCAYKKGYYAGLHGKKNIVPKLYKTKNLTNHFLEGFRSGLFLRRKIKKQMSINKNIKELGNIRSQIDLIIDRLDKT